MKSKSKMSYNGNFTNSTWYSYQFCWCKFDCSIKITGLFGCYRNCVHRCIVRTMDWFSYRCCHKYRDICYQPYATTIYDCKWCDWFGCRDLWKKSNVQDSSKNICSSSYYLACGFDYICANYCFGLRWSYWGEWLKCNHDVFGCNRKRIMGICYRFNCTYRNFG